MGILWIVRGVLTNGISVNIILACRRQVVLEKWGNSWINLKPTFFNLYSGTYFQKKDFDTQRCIILATILCKSSIITWFYHIGIRSNFKVVPSSIIWIKMKLLWCKYRTHAINRPGFYSKIIVWCFRLSHKNHIKILFSL